LKNALQINHVYFQLTSATESPPLVPDFSVPSSQLGVMRVSALYPVKSICSQ
jgi:hypothetical protein